MGRPLGSAKAKAQIKKALDASEKAPSVESLLSHFFAFAGGDKALAKLLWDEYKGSPVGSSVRARVTELLLRSMKFADSRRTELDDFGLLTEDDLDAEIARCEKELLGRTRAAKDEA